MKHFYRWFLLLVLLVALITLAVGQSQSSSGEYPVYLPFIRKASEANDVPTPTTTPTPTPTTTAPSETRRVTVHSDGTQANSSSYSPAISGDGRYIAFYSDASNLVGGDTNNRNDIFVHDTQTGITERVSVASDGTEADSFSVLPAISDDGRYVAFLSGASNLVVGDTNGKTDIFVHDRQTDATERVSVHSDGTQGDSHSIEPAISGDGRYVAFQSGASNLVGGDTNSRYDVFVHDRQTGTMERVSVHSDGTEGDSHSRYPAISDDGRYVAFETLATNLVDGDTNGRYDVFIHDTQTDATERVSVHSDGTEGNEHSFVRAISDDGRYVAFGSYASNLVDGDTNSYHDVFVHDRQTDATERVSVHSNGTEGNEASGGGAISNDGRYVAFGSSANNLVDDDTNGTNDAFVHDTETGATVRISVHSNGTEGNDASGAAAISDDGRYVAFGSYATNLVDGDTNDATDIFVRDRGPLK